MVDPAAHPRSDSASLQKETLENTIVDATFLGEEQNRLKFTLADDSVAFVERDEFADSVPFESGDKVRVLVENPFTDGWMASVKKAEKLAIWDSIERQHKTRQSVPGTILGVNQGGMTVDIGVRAFLPMSQIDTHPVKDATPYVGMESQFEIIKFDSKRADVVVSRRNTLEKKKANKVQAALESLEPGQEFDGTVRTITNFGAFVDIGGMDGLLHISNMSWGRLDHPSELVSVGESIRVVVLDYKPEKKRLSLGRKQLLKDPWLTLAEDFQEGMRVSGKVVSLTEFGAFVELAPGLDGLVHVTELAWTGRINHPKDVLAVDQTIDVKILNIDTENRRLSLSVKQLEANPWLQFEEQNPAGTRLQGTIRNIADFGLFVEVAPGIEGLVHVSDLSWTEKIDDPRTHYKVGQTLEVVILEIDTEAERVALGVKQLVDDPWLRASEIAKPGQKIDVTITKLLDFGAMATVIEGVEGLIHISELREERVEKVSEVVRPGQVHKALVLTFDRGAQRISLSLKRDQLGDTEESAREYTEDTSATATLGDILRDRLGLQSSEDIAAEAESNDVDSQVTESDSNPTE